MTIEDEVRGASGTIEQQVRQILNKYTDDLRHSATKHVTVKSQYRELGLEVDAALATLRWVQSRKAEK